MDCLFGARPGTVLFLCKEQKTRLEAKPRRGEQALKGKKKAPQKETSDSSSFHKPSMVLPWRLLYLLLLLLPPSPGKLGDF